MMGGRSWRILERGIYRGPHYYSHTPMIRLQVDLGDLEQWPTDKLPGFATRLLEQLPGLARHGCSLGKPGGLTFRLQKGTWLGHVVEHVALELQVLAGAEVTRGKTRSLKGQPGIYNVMFEYESEALGLQAGRVAFELVDALLPPELCGIDGLDLIAPQVLEGPFELAQAIAALKQIGESNRLGPSTRAIVSEAERRGIPVCRLDEYSLIQLGTGRWQKRLRASITGDTSHLAVETAGNKDLTKRLLSAAGVPVPEGKIVRSKEDAVMAARRIGFPVVLKPLDGNHGRGVTTNVHTPAQVEGAFDRAQAHRPSVLIERHFAGRDYRVLVVNGRVAAAAERRPASVVGNGVDTIGTLIEQVNADPRRGNGHEKVMTRIRLDPAVMLTLERQGLAVLSIPDAGAEIVLADTANLSTGGSAIDRSLDMHPDNVTMAQRAALVIGLDVAGIDLVMPDIARSWRDTGGGVVEVNAAPGLRMHLHPAEGTPRPVARPIVSALFPPGRAVRVPIAAVTGTNGKSTTVRMVAHVLTRSGKRVGFTSTSGIYVGTELLWPGDASGPKSGRRLLRDPTIDYAVLETARGGILREGLAAPDIDVGAVLNVTADHLGLQGILTLDDLAGVKSVVVESVRKNGLSVLNADDARTLAMARHAGGRICFFSLSASRIGIVGEHIAAGGLAVLREKIAGLDQIVLYDRGEQIPVVPVEGIPATFAGALEFNVQNALAAAGICVGLGLEPDVIGHALGSFASTFEQNPGRFNVHDGHGFRVILDYAHNQAGLSALLKSVQAMRPPESRLLGSISMPGDRRDEDIRAMGRIAGPAFDLVVFRELPDNRGRPAGEVVGLLAEGALQAGCLPDRILCIRSEEEAAAECLRRARSGDVVILTPSKVEDVWRQVIEFRPGTAQPRGNGNRRQQVVA